VEEMMEKAALDLHGTNRIPYEDQIIDFSRPFKRISMIEAIREFAGVNIGDMDEDRLRNTCFSLGIDTDTTMGKGKLIDRIFGEKVEPNLVQPTFIIDYPREMSPLCKKHRKDPRLTERFELIINRKEICNAYSELNDPIDQKERFQEQLRLSEKGDDEAMFIDQDFLRALEYGMPPTSGLGVGIDRLAMILTNQPSIQDVLFFPQMRPEKAEKPDTKDTFVAAGIPEEWFSVLQQLGYNTVDKVRKVEKPGKLHQEVCGFNKKNKLNLRNPTQEEVAKWVSQ
jgi:lysyl-tRNA synthetase class 2